MNRASTEGRDESRIHGAGDESRIHGVRREGFLESAPSAV
jgi:hypothetical protein